MLNALRSLNSDGRLLFATRFVRLFAYGALSVVLVLYLVALGLTESNTGLLLTATLLGMAIGGWMSGAIFDFTGSYRAAFINGIGWNLLNLTIAFFLLRRLTAVAQPRTSMA